jgi:hypothetical protein
VKDHQICGNPAWSRRTLSVFVVFVAPRTVYDLTATMGERFSGCRKEVYEFKDKLELRESCWGKPLRRAQASPPDTPLSPARVR